VEFSFLYAMVAGYTKDNNLFSKVQYFTKLCCDLKGSFDALALNFPVSAIFSLDISWSGRRFLSLASSGTHCQWANVHEGIFFGIREHSIYRSSRRQRRFPAGAHPRHSRPAKLTLLFALALSRVRRGAQAADQPSAYLWYVLVKRLSRQNGAG
jgi:hypothetical protein